jgi:flagellar biosynthesis protein FlhA
MFDMNKARNWAQWLVPIGIVACLMIIFVPMPAAIMDMLLAANITIAVIILLTTVYVRTPLELSIFPSLLLATTMMRLSLNIATTRLILTRGSVDGHLAAGEVINSFGGFVAGNQIAVGLIIFAIIVIVQFVVITKGATRISEVSARFALDGLPGKQMAIDAELNAGNITQEEATHRRNEIADHADFYGAMDGASKFVRGDAIAGVLITVINILGGLFIGLSQGMNIAQAGDIFTRLTIGDGLVSQLPALLISVAAGLLLTRGTRKTDLPKETVDQLFSRPGIMLITAGFLAVLVFTKLPAIPLLLIAGACGSIAYLLFQQKPTTGTVQDKPKPKPQSLEQPISKLLESDAMEMELGIDLIPLADTRKGGTLLSEITSARIQLAKELGIILPKVRVRDNLKQLQPNQFRVMLHGNQVLAGTIEPAQQLIADCRNADQETRVSTTSDFPWLPHAGWTESAVQDSMAPTKVLRDALNWIAHRHASELLTRDATWQLVDELKKNSPTVVDELIPNQMSLGQVQQVLSALVFEGVTLRPLNLILEALSDFSQTTTDRRELVENVRQRLARQISHGLRNERKNIVCFGISEELQHRIAVGFEATNSGFSVDLPSTTVDKLRQSIAIGAEHMQSINRRPVLYVEQVIRPVVAWLVEDMLPQLCVIGTSELSPDTQVDLIAEITTEDIIATNNAAAA